MRGLFYREDAVNHCPGCGRTHWHVGRTMAECAFCATALPLGGATFSSNPKEQDYDDSAVAS